MRGQKLFEFEEKVTKWDFLIKELPFSSLPSGNLNVYVGI